jgi:hypothetical protein
MLNVERQILNRKQERSARTRNLFKQLERHHSEPHIAPPPAQSPNNNNPGASASKSATATLADPSDSPDAAASRPGALPS